MNTISDGKGYLAIGDAFRAIAREANLKKGETVIFSGCPGPCFSYTTSYAGELREFGPVVYFAPFSNTDEAWKLGSFESLGISAIKKEKPGKAKLIFVMCGLTIDAYALKSGRLERSSEEILESTNRMIEEHLATDGKVILETALETDMPNIFQRMNWKDRMIAHYTIEYGVGKVKATRIE